MDLGQSIAVYLGIFLLIWYAFAAAYNRRRGVRTFRWLRPGVATQGDITHARWLGSSGSGARLQVQKAKKPFRNMEVAFLLETRELLPLWLVNLLRKRRDSLIVRADLHSVPQAELEILPHGDARFRELMTADTRLPWAMLERQLPGGLRSAGRGRAPERLLEAIVPLLERLTPAVRRLSVARTSPHLIGELYFPALIDSGAEELFRALAETFTPAPSAEPES